MARAQARPAYCFIRPRCPGGRRERHARRGRLSVRGLLCARAGFSVWQTLPLGPVDRYGSPYCLRSAHAGDPRLIDSDYLRRLRAAAARLRVRPGAARRERQPTARSWLSRLPRAAAAFAQFVRAQRRWLLPFGLFELCRARFSRAIRGGAGPSAFRTASAQPARVSRGGTRSTFRARAVRAVPVRARSGRRSSVTRTSAASISSAILPFYVDLNSVEVWWDRELFRLDADGRPVAVAGVPPDYFNADGQLWGNPLYDWDAMRARRFRMVACAPRRLSYGASTSCVSIIFARSSRTGRCRPAHRPRARASGGTASAIACLQR